MQVDFMNIKGLVLPPRGFDFSNTTSIKKTLTSLFYTVIQSSLYGAGFSGACGSVVALDLSTHIKVLVLSSIIFTTLSIKIGLQKYNMIDKKNVKPVERIFFHNIILGIVVGAFMFQLLDGMIGKRGALMSKGIENITILTMGLVFGVLSEKSNDLLDSMLDPEERCQLAKLCISRNVNSLLHYKKEISKENFLFLHRLFRQKVSFKKAL